MTPDEAAVLTQAIAALRAQGQRLALALEAAQVHLKEADEIITQAAFWLGRQWPQA